MGAKLLQQNIGGDLEKAVRDEEDDEGGVVLRTLETELIGEAEYVGIGNVDAIFSIVSSLFPIRMGMDKWTGLCYRERPTGT